MELVITPEFELRKSIFLSFRNKKQYYIWHNSYSNCEGGGSFIFNQCQLCGIEFSKEIIFQRNLLNV